jgi:hypothetical protein
MSGDSTGRLWKVSVPLNPHQLHMLGEDAFWLIQMTTTASEKVHASRLEQEANK